MAPFTIMHPGGRLGAQYEPGGAGSQPPLPAPQLQGPLGQVPPSSGAGSHKQMPRQPGMHSSPALQVVPPHGPPIPMSEPLDTSSPQPARSAHNRKNRAIFASLKEP
jgi:hypothetical protein